MYITPAKWRPRFVLHLRDSGVTLKMFRKIRPAVHALDRVAQISLAAFLVPALAGAWVFCVPTGTAAQTQPGETAAAPPTAGPDPSAGQIESGFYYMYVLDFQGARVQFVDYQKAHPDDPLGTVSEAASYLYEQFNVKGVLSSAFFLDNDKFLGGVDGTPAENKNEQFLDANHRARDMSNKRLKSNPQDAEGLLALTLADGMESDYDALIVKKPMAGLSLMKQANAEAAKLLEVDPTAQDAYVALGAANYVIGCMPSFKKAFLWFDGVHGDRVKGMQEMQLAADKGRYLSPFAKVLLALAYEREHQPDQARALLKELSDEFPSNPLYARELALVDHQPPRNK